MSVAIKTENVSKLYRLGAALPRYRPTQGAMNKNLTEKAYGEVVDLFARGTTSIEIVGFKPSPETQERARYLLDRSMSVN